MGINKKNFCVLSSVLLFGINQYLDIIIGLTLLLYIFFSTEESLYYIYIFMLPWDKVLSINGIGSIFRIIQIIILAKYFIGSIETKGLIKSKGITKTRIFIISYFFIYSVISIMFYRNSSMIGILLNFIIILNIKVKGKFSDHLFIEYYLLSMILAIIYGLIHNNFILGWIDGVGEINRFSGIYEPNFMGMYINIAIYFIFHYKLFIHKKYLICIFILCGALLLTVSFTGAAVLCIILFSYSIMYYKYIIKKINIIFPLILVGIFILYKMDLLYYVFKRFDAIINNLAAGNIDRVTSGRTELSNIYLQEFLKLNIFSKLLGTASSAYELLSVKYPAINYSHNTNIDILFTFGIIGYIITFLYFIYESFIVNSENNKFILLKIIILIYSFSLSMFSSRFYYFFMII